MLGFGEPVHYSVFRCDLTPRGKVEMAASLHDLIDPDEDRIMIIEDSEKPLLIDNYKYYH